MTFIRTLLLILVFGLWFESLKAEPVSARMASPKNLALVLGGADDTLFGKATFQFGSDRLKEALAQSGFSIRSNFGQGIFKAEAADQLIAKQIQDLESGTIPSGSQLAVIIDAHGGECNAEGGHSIVDSDGKMFNLKKLEAIKVAAKKAGVKLAIADSSCYSGCSLDLADEETCVISSSNAKSPAGSNFTYGLYYSIKPGSNLEAAFLAARSSFASRSGAPQISTLAGREAATTLNVIHDTVATHDESLPKTEAWSHLCSLSGMQASEEVIRNLRDKLLGSACDNPQILDDLKGALSANYNLRKTVEKDVAFESKKVKIAGEDIPYRSLADVDRTMRRYKASLARTTDPEVIDFYKKLIKAEPEYRRWQSELLKTEPEFKKINANRAMSKEFIAMTERSAQLTKSSERVLKCESKIYDCIYKKNNEKKSGANPCASFKF